MMKPIGGGRRTDQEFPTSDFDLKPYRQRWEAAEKSCNFQNEETYPNRYILFGRPQIGKTGVFLHLAFLLWEKAGSPQFTWPRTENALAKSLTDLYQRREGRLSTGSPEKEIPRWKRNAEEELVEPNPGKIRKRENSTSSSSDIDGIHQEQQPSDGEEALSAGDRKLIVDGGQGKELEGNLNKDVTENRSATGGKGTLPELGSQRPCQKRSKSKSLVLTSEDSESDKNSEGEKLTVMTAMISFFINSKEDWEREKVEKKQDKDEWKQEKEEWRRERKEWKQEMEVWKQEREICKRETQ